MYIHTMCLVCSQHPHGDSSQDTTNHLLIHRSKEGVKGVKKGSKHVQIHENPCFCTKCDPFVTPSRAGLSEDLSMSQDPRVLVRPCTCPRWSQDGLRNSPKRGVCTYVQNRGFQQKNRGFCAILLTCPILEVSKRGKRAKMASFEPLLAPVDTALPGGLSQDYP